MCHTFPYFNLLDTLNLEEYDKELSESQLNYIPNDEKKESIAQKKDKLGLTYIYLRNELHLERLAEEDIDLLKKETESIETGILSDEAMRMVIMLIKSMKPRSKEP